MLIEQSKTGKGQKYNLQIDEHLANLFVKERIDSLEQRITKLEANRQERRTKRS